MICTSRPDLAKAVRKCPTNSADRLWLGVLMACMLFIGVPAAIGLLMMASSPPPDPSAVLVPP